MMLLRVLSIPNRKISVYAIQEDVVTLDMNQMISQPEAALDPAVQHGPGQALFLNSYWLVRSLSPAPDSSRAQKTF